MSTRHLPLKGASIMYAGRLTKTSWDAAVSRIKAGGGVAVYTISDKLTFFVAGVQAGSKEVKARSRGVTIISEAQLALLLDQGFLDIEDTPAIAPVTPLNDSIAELRALFDGEPTSDGWTRCLEIIEGCDTERIEDLLAYAQRFVAGWDQAAMGQWQPPPKHALMAKAPKYWSPSLFVDELRVAPPSWIYEMSQGRYAPKHALARALNLEGMKLNGKLAQAIIDNPHLRHVKKLNLGYNKLPKTFYAALRTSELMRSVEELWTFDPCDLLKQAWSAPAHTFGALRTIRSFYHISPQERAAMPCLANATSGPQPTPFWEHR